MGSDPAGLTGGMLGELYEMLRVEDVDELPCPGGSGGGTPAAGWRGRGRGGRWQLQQEGGTGRLLDTCSGMEDSSITPAKNGT